MSQSREYLSSEEIVQAKEQSEDRDLNNTEQEQEPKPAQDKRSLIRPKLRKRATGVSLTESKPSQKSSGVKAPRSLGPFPESDKVK